MHGVGDDQGLASDASTITHLQVLGIKPQVGEGALQRAGAKDIHAFIKPAADCRDTVLAHPADAQLFHQPIDLSGRYAVDVRSSITTDTMACSHGRRGSRNDGK